MGEPWAPVSARPAADNGTPKPGYMALSAPAMATCGSKSCKSAAALTPSEIVTESAHE